MKIIHFSDPHAGGGAEDWMAYFDKRWVGVFNYRFRRRFQHDLSKLEKAVEYILDVKPDAVVCTGDLTSSGQPGEFEKTKVVLQKLRDSNIPILYTPGNHDCYVKRPKCVKAVHDMVDYLSCGRYQFKDFPVKVHVKGIDFLLVNTSRPSNLLCSWGFLVKKDSLYLENECANEHLYPRIMVSHYPLIDHHPILRVRHRLFGEKRALKLLRDKKIDVMLAGHVHSPRLTLDETGRGECIAGSVTRNSIMFEIDYNKDNNTFNFSEVKL
jgi:Icc-related predicted phosphoesterase